jgi:hypothetical protein
MQQIKLGVEIIMTETITNNPADVLLSKVKVNALEEIELTKFLTKNIKQTSELQIFKNLLIMSRIVLDSSLANLFSLVRLSITLNTN